jgi:AraC-like DNA-binding protein
MKAHFEKVLHDNSSIVAFERVGAEFPSTWHFHHEFELAVIVDGSGQRIVGDGIDDYGPGDVVLLGPDLLHCWRTGPIRVQTEQIHRALVIHFRENFLGDQFFSVAEMQPISLLLKRSACGLAFGHTTAGRSVARQLLRFQSLSPIERLLMLVSVLGELSRETQAQKLSTDRVRPICRAYDQRRIDAICTLLNQNYDSVIDLERVARHVHMDPSYLCRFFKRATGRTIMTYVNECRVGAATQLMVETEMSLLDIAFQVGFGNYSNFHRQFRRMRGYTPMALRQQLQKNIIVEPKSARDPKGPARFLTLARLSAQRRNLDCSPNLVPADVRQAQMRGAWKSTWREAYAGAD